MDTVGLPLLSIIAACIYIFRPQDWFPEVQQAVPMVFSCVASRNKRAGELSTEPIGDLEPGLVPFSYFCGS